MDFQHRPGGKTGSGGVASASESNRDRRERLRQLALETIDINKDPYFMKNHLGSYECKLCLTLHNNEVRGHLARRAAKEAKEAPAQPAPEKVKVEVKKFVKIGRPGYKVTKQRDPETGQQSLLFQIDYPEIAESIMPRHRFMSAYEQRIEPPDRRWQYLLMAAEPYETIAFKVPSREIDKAEGKFWTHWNRETKQFFLQFHFKMEKPPAPPNLPPRAPDRQAAAAPSPDERAAPAAPPARLHAPPSPRGHGPAPHAPLGAGATPPSAPPAAPSARGAPPCPPAPHDAAAAAHRGAGHHPPSPSLQLKPLLDSIPWELCLFNCSSAPLQGTDPFCTSAKLSELCRFIKRFLILPFPLLSCAAFGVHFPHPHSQAGYILEILQKGGKGLGISRHPPPISCLGLRHPPEAVPLITPH
uniref:Uncharacterized protein n=1 Tax=Geospiza parvula TaxID=87175 RepID=A0A8C3N4F0_GEOPR